MINQRLIHKISKERNLKQSTISGYESSLNKYSEFHNQSLEFLLDEAVEEEKNLVPLKERKIKTRLMDFRKYLYESNLSAKTSRTYFSKVLVFYRHFEVEIPNLPEAQREKEYESEYRDLPTKEDIAKAIEISDSLMKAIILFMSSSGTARAETLSLSIEDFIKATGDYHKSDDINDVINKLSKKDNIIPTFYLKRIKTNKYYYTYCSFEATTYILNYLKTRKNLKNSDKLFDITESTLTLKFRQINDEMKWGYKGKYRFFRSHTLRKFHASNIQLSIEYIDALQGRGKSEIHETYIKENPEKLKKIYEKAQKNILIFKHDPKEIHNEYNIIIYIFLGSDHIKIDYF